MIDYLVVALVVFFLVPVVGGWAIPIAVVPMTLLLMISNCLKASGK